ncbi:hypothetical protein ASPWEDRAFT_35015 [Aspergillus wentii DTO 134E9]|uniref:Uncharacterized protein n=1 Tax=Aspergillus wentii DTO 134E9 TaxID=1073089 RepID=A0A1L9S2S1_ASPWE|nr:uncharacterized protein ASPWEDRAFT_35015 [Aspergillus wentii DTO 134E9]OJJ41460.1 hypothetical protein ASPWEDRAFT_35015 [Aspergillus wentii DTO 134E9]
MPKPPPSWPLTGPRNCLQTAGPSPTPFSLVPAAALRLPVSVLPLAFFFSFPFVDLQSFLQGKSQHLPLLQSNKDFPLSSPPQLSVSRAPSYPLNSSTPLFKLISHLKQFNFNKGSLFKAT